MTFWLGTNHTVFQEGIFFSKAALVTLGGAYAVLPYVAQQTLQTHRWLSAGQMLDGLGLTETTPGPLIMVTPICRVSRRLESPRTVAADRCCHVVHPSGHLPLQSDKDRGGTGTEK
jgi:hypothetical protein